MTFYVYHDPPTSEVVIHKADCPHCNYGHGHGKAGGDTSIWYPSFATYQAAWDFAQKIPAKKRHPCGHCNPP